VTSDESLERACEEGADLFLFNREMPFGFESDQGHAHLVIVLSLASKVGHVEGVSYRTFATKSLPTASQAPISTEHYDFTSAYDSSSIGSVG